MDHRNRLSLPRLAPAAALAMVVGASWLAPVQAEEPTPEPTPVVFAQPQYLHRTGRPARAAA